MKHLWNIGICVAVVVFGCSFKNLSEGEHSKQILKNLCQGNTHSSEEVLLDSLEDLSFNEKSIRLNVEGFSYEVHSLQKTGNQWIAALHEQNSGRINGYCQKGHDLCNCGTCHLRFCPYYIPPCNLWDKR